MTIRQDIQQRFAEFSCSMQHAPGRDRVIYHLVHGGMILIAALCVLCGFPWAVWAAVVLSLTLTAREPWQVQLSRRFSVACLALIGLYLIGLLIAWPFEGPQGPLADFYGLIAFLIAGVALILWFWSADRLYKVQFQLPPEDTGPW